MCQVRGAAERDCFEQIFEQISSSGSSVLSFSFPEKHTCSVLEKIIVMPGGVF